MKMVRSIILATGVLAAGSAGAQPVPPIPVILDTDCGFASDDAMALLALLQSERVDLLGVTVVTGNDWLKQEVQNVLRLLEIAGRPEVPVFAGSERPLITSQEERIRSEKGYGEASGRGLGGWGEAFNQERGRDDPPREGLGGDERRRLQGRLARGRTGP